MWWVLHLLYGQKHGFYSRPYRDLAVRDRIVPTLFSVIKGATRDSDFLLQMAFETLSLLTEDKSLRLPLIKANFFQIITRCSTPFAPTLITPNEPPASHDDNDMEIDFSPREESTMKRRDSNKSNDFNYTAGMAALKNMFSDPSSYRHEQEDTLKRKCENFLFANTEKEDWLAAAELGHQHDFWQIKAYFMAKMFGGRMAEFKIDSVVSRDFQDELYALAITKRNFSKFMYLQLKNALKGDNRTKVDVNTIHSCLRLLIQIDDFAAAEEMIQIMNAVGIAPSAETYYLVQLVNDLRI
jgi:hypothetical protein